MRWLWTAAAMMAATQSVYAQSASFAYRLGNDTVAIETYSRAGNRVMGAMVQRTGNAVLRFEYDMTVAPNGLPQAATFRRMQGDGTPIPNAASEFRYRFTADSVIREAVFRDSTQRRAFAAPGAMLNFPVFMYGPTELLLTQRRAQRTVDSIPALGFGAMTFVGLETLGGDTLRLRGSAYPMLLRFDRNGRLLSIDGSLTTNKVVAARSERSVDIAAVARSMKPTGVLSGREVARASFGPGGIVLVDYGRPQVRERTVWGGTLVPYDSIWRAGANDATHLMTTRTITIGGLTIPPGMYTLFVQHTRSGTFLIVNRRTGIWGTQYDGSQDLGRVQMTAAPRDGHVEEFTMAVRALGGNRGALDMVWGDRSYTVPFTVSAR